MMIPMGTVVEMCFPPLQDFLPTLLSCCREVGDLYGFSRNATLRLEVALEEAMTSILPQKDKLLPLSENISALAKPLTVQFRRVPLGMRVVFSDFTASLDKASMDSYSPEQEPDEEQNSGLGLFLMRSLADQVAIYNFEEEGRGKELHLFKMLQREAETPAPSTLTHPLPEASEAFVHTPPTTSGRVPPSEVSDIVSSFCWQPSSTDEPLSSKLLAEALSDPDITLFVAWGKQHEPLALQAISAYPQRHSLAVALPPLFSRDAEHSACAALLLDELTRHATQEGGIEGILGFVPRISSAAANLFVSRGFTECAILPTLLGNSFLKGNCTGMAFFRSLIHGNSPAETVASEASQEALVLEKEERPVSSLYAPKRHHSLIRLICGDKKLPLFAIRESDQEALKQRSIISAAAEFQKQKCNLVVHNYGLDFSFQLSVLTKQLLRRETPILALYLPMELPATATGAEDAERQGYVFCGVIPGTPGGGELLYIHCSTLPEILDQVAPATKTGQEILLSARKECRRIRFLQKLD